ncbi:MAG: DUF6528 family protein [Planctomycetota bacterium]
MDIQRLLTYLLAALVGLISAPAVAAQDQLICSGAEEVFILRINPDSSETPEIVWSWTADASPEIPESARRTFASTDECKPLGEFVLITSSSGGVALVRRSDKSCRFYTHAKNAHSACLLPENIVAVASSFGGDELLVYDRTQPFRTPAKPIARIPLRGAHGTVWDDGLERLWALGSDELLLVNLKSQSMPLKLDVEKRFELPSPGGHDLSQSRNSSILFVTTDNHVYRFDKSRGRFTPYEALADQPKVKSISEHPQTGEVVYHQGTPENWWSDTIRFLGKREKIVLPDRRLYKVRWD